jgi:4-hydroxy-tetrahydrodipicolinate reductase
VSESATGKPIRTVLVGATGRMGSQILRLLPQYPAIKLIGAVASRNSAAIGEDAASHAGGASNGIRISAPLAPLLGDAELVIDFSRADATAENLSACVAARVPLLIGTTGLPPSLQASCDSAAATIALLVAPNTSLAVNLLLELVARGARALPPAFEIEILESHHRDKRDAPSGTALALGRAAAQARGTTLEQSAVYARHGQASARSAEQIGFAVTRGGDVVGEHEVRFLGEGEQLALRHVASDRAVFARGALKAGQWLATKPPGRYEMRDLFE